MNLTIKHNFQQFDYYLSKCRCCFKPFEEEDDNIQITILIQKRFEDITNLKVC